MPGHEDLNNPADGGGEGDPTIGLDGPLLPPHVSCRRLLDSSTSGWLSTTPSVRLDLVAPRFSKQQLVGTC